MKFFRNWGADPLDRNGEHFDYYGYRAVHHNALVAVAQPVRHVHCKHEVGRVIRSSQVQS